MDNGSSSSYSSSRYRHSSGGRGRHGDESPRHGRHHHHRHKRRRSSRSRSRSRSPSTQRPSTVYINPALNPLYRQEKTISEYEMRIQALATQLQASQGQVAALEGQLRTSEQGRRELELQLYTSKQESTNLTFRNAEIMNVMKALEQGVETLQKEKAVRERKLTEAQREKQEVEKALAREKEQLALWNERNVTLSNKCGTLVAQNKEMKEKLASAEQEIARLRPTVERLDNELRKKTQEHTYATLKMASLDAKERMWAKEKVEMQQRLKDLTAANARKNADGAKGQSAAVATAARKEQIKKLESLLEAMHHHHESQVESLHQQLSAMSGVDVTALVSENGELSAGSTAGNGKHVDGVAGPSTSIDYSKPNKPVAKPTVASANGGS